jgi:hypothetical protein
MKFFFAKKRYKLLEDGKAMTGQQGLNCEIILGLRHAIPRVRVFL